MDNMKIYVLAATNVDASIACVIANIASRHTDTECHIKQFHKSDAFFESYLSTVIGKIQPADVLFILGIEPSEKALDTLKEARLSMQPQHLCMYTCGSTNVYTDWSHVSNKSLSEQFISDDLVREMLSGIPAYINKRLNELVRSVTSEDSDSKSIKDAYNSVKERFVSIVTKQVLDPKDQLDKSSKCPRYIHFTHGDLDAAGCCVLLDVAYNLGGNAYEHRFCKNPTDCAEQIKEFLSELDDKTEYNVLISDISIKDEAVADELDAAFKSGKIANLHLYDHHPTAKWMEKYPWCKIEISHINEEDGKETKTCGTELLYDYFEDITGIFVTRPTIDTLVAAYVEIVRLYDTYDWKQHGDYGKIAYNHNTIFNRYGMSKYATLMATRLSTGNDVRQFTNEQKEMIAEEDAKFEAHLEECRKLLTVRSDYIDGIGAFKYGALFCSKYTSETGNRLSTEHPELAFILMINTDKMKVEIRTARDDFDTSEFAKINGGGGHPKASGFPLNYSDLHNMAQALRVQ